MWSVNYPRKLLAGQMGNGCPRSEICVAAVGESRKDCSNEKSMQHVHVCCPDMPMTGINLVLFLAYSFLSFLESAKTLSKYLEDKQRNRTSSTSERFKPIWNLARLATAALAQAAPADVNALLAV